MSDGAGMLWADSRRGGRDDGGRGARRRAGAARSGATAEGKRISEGDGAPPRLWATREPVRDAGRVRPSWMPPRCSPGNGGYPPKPALAVASSAVYNGTVTSRAMQEATFLILTALAARSQHGYGIITDVLEISGGRVRLRAGTLYTALDRLRAEELIEVDREEVVETRLRRYYRLTPAGSTRLAAEAARLQANAAAALSRLRLAGGIP